jgi:hypothetical protein
MNNERRHKSRYWVIGKGACVGAVLVLLWLTSVGAVHEHDNEQEPTVEELLPVEHASYSPIELQLGQPGFVEAGDFDGDGHTDLVLITFAESEKEGHVMNHVHMVKVDWQTGGASSRTLYSVQDALPVFYHAVVADLNADGHLDIVVADSSAGAIIVFWGDGRGSFMQEALELGHQGFITSLGVADFDGDGSSDLVYVDVVLGHVGVLWNDKNTRFSSRTLYTFPRGHVPGTLVVGDFTNDGHHDLAILGAREEGAGFVHSLTVLSTGGGRAVTLLSTVNIGAPDRMERPVLAASDIDRDGHLDLITVRNQYTYILLGKGDGTFVVRRWYPLLQALLVSQVILADIDSDGCPNEIVLGMLTPCLWLSTGCYGSNRYVLVAPYAGIPMSAVVADVNDDGQLDVIIASNSGLGSTYLEVLFGRARGAP